MAFWRENMFFMNFKNHIVKWYQTVLMPVLHIDHSGKKSTFRSEDEMTEEKEESQANAGSDDGAKGGADQSTSGMTVTMPAQKKKAENVTGDAAAVLDRINTDRENEFEKTRREAEEARRKADEEARLAAIMNANKVDVDSFIEQGKSAAEEAEKKAADDAKAAEELRRAQEIIDRLNREAAEDEAKKQAELDAAKAAAAEKFGE